MLKKIIAAASAILLFANALMAQQPSGGVKGTVVTRGTREPVQNARLELYSGAEMLGTVLSAEDGTFMISGLPDGMYTLVITSSEYMRNTVNVTVNDGYVKNMFNLSLTPTISEEVREEMSLTEFDMDDSGYSDSPTILFGSNDIFTQLTSYNWSSIRFKNRGYLSESQDVYLAGVRMNDAVTGYSPFSLW
ncbi:MAG: carboxypeptidase-like regulatory domain-containing protein, partial [Rikenellaceae bacterium]|nr:carboxypeptidase-like regulatory domain-containing protein [Rikenellaceae bacterium]